MNFKKLEQGEFIIYIQNEDEENHFIISKASEINVDNLLSLEYLTSVSPESIKDEVISLIKNLLV